MNFGFIKVGAATPEICVADTDFNKNSIIAAVLEANNQNVKVLVFPELCLTGSTCGDLFYQETLLNGAKEALLDIVKATSAFNMLIFIGMPMCKNGKIYNTAVAICNGRVLGVVPKTYFNRKNAQIKQFFAASVSNDIINIGGDDIPFGTKLIFTAEEMPNLRIASEIADDLWAMQPPSVYHAMAGSTVIVNLAAAIEIIGAAEYRKNLISIQSARLSCGYIYANAGSGESTTDTVFAGHNIIAENGEILAESELFNNGIIVSELDVDMLATERTKTECGMERDSSYKIIPFNLKVLPTNLTRTFNPLVFIPNTKSELYNRIELVLQMQAEGLKKRLLHAKAKCAVIGVSGGLDSCLALLVAAKAKSIMPKDIAQDFSILGITMPCFGTTKRTYNNANALCELLRISLKEIDISASVTLHLKEIGHNGAADIAYENAQARERTQVLMDIANSKGGLVIGTGDLSELALGWATYNGDHMSMYGVNSSLPKTFIQQMIRYIAKKSDKKLHDILIDIVETPISPELLPQKDDVIHQKTEDKVGSYMLHDFFLYYTVRKGFSPSKVLYIAERAFLGQFTPQEVKKWLKVFVCRFFAHQFKRSCLPDGIKIGSVSLSPRGDFCMPSDACSALWQKELE